MLFRSQDLDGAPQCPGLAGGKPEDVEEDEEEELEDDDSLAGRSQDDTASPTPEPQGAYADEEEEVPPASLAVGFDHTRRWAPALRGPRVPGDPGGGGAEHRGGGPHSHTCHPPSGAHPASQQAFLQIGRASCRERVSSPV